QPARPATEFDHAIGRLQPEVVQQLLGRSCEVGVLDLQPPGGVVRLSEDVVGVLGHGVAQVNPEDQRLFSGLTVSRPAANTTTQPTKTPPLNPGKASNERVGEAVPPTNDLPR